jgi:hypothetical protein
VGVKNVEVLKKLREFGAVQITMLFGSEARSNCRILDLSAMLISAGTEVIIAGTLQR